MGHSQVSQITLLIKKLKVLSFFIHTRLRHKTKQPQSHIDRRNRSILNWPSLCLEESPSSSVDLPSTYSRRFYFCCWQNQYRKCTQIALCICFDNTESSPRTLRSLPVPKSRFYYWLNSTTTEASLSFWFHSSTVMMIVVFCQQPLMSSTTTDTVEICGAWWVCKTE